MLSSAFIKALARISEEVDPIKQTEQIQLFGRMLFESPGEVDALLTALTQSKVIDSKGEHMSSLLTVAIDEARMSRDNGQAKGAEFIETLETRLKSLVGPSENLAGLLMLSDAWVRAGLTPPECLSKSVPDNIYLAFPSNPGKLDAELNSFLDVALKESFGSVSILQQAFTGILYTLPEGVRETLVRVAVGRSEEVFLELGLSWLLEPAEVLCRGALAGLFDRLAEGRISASALARLVIVRGWLADPYIKAAIGELLHTALRNDVGTSSLSNDSGAKLHRVVASLVDGSGSQSLAASVQVGGRRFVGITLLQEGFGVKEAYVVPCGSATEQRGILDQISQQVNTFDVPKAWMEQAIGLAISEGLEKGLSPVPGLVEFAKVCGLTAIRPIPYSVKSILDLSGINEFDEGLSAQSSKQLLVSSRLWERDYPVIASWFESSDDVATVLSAEKTRSGLTRSMWNFLDGRREYWGRILARNAYLLRAVGANHADAFVAVSASIEAGLELEEIPAMELICRRSIEAWLHALGKYYSEFEADAASKDTTSSPSEERSEAQTELTPEILGEWSNMLEPTRISECWCEGYFYGICAAPVDIYPPEWLAPLLNLIEDTLKSDMEKERFLTLAMYRYNDCLVQLENSRSISTLDDPMLASFWADGFLTAWEVTSPYWPATSLDSEVMEVREVLDAATNGQFKQDFSGHLTRWLNGRFKAQKK